MPDAAAKDMDPTGKRVIGVNMDVTSEQQVDGGMEKAVKAFGKIDIMVSNAGIQIVAPIEDFKFDDWKN